MTFADDRVDDLADIFDTGVFGAAATYQAPTPGTAAIACTILVNERQQLQLGQDSAAQEHRKWDVQVRTSEVTLPVRHATFTVATGDHAGTFTVENIESLNAGVAMLSCRKATIRALIGDGAQQVQA